jgi:hypothetical protein
MSIKRLYEFTVNKQEEVEEKQTSTNEKGEEVTTSVKTKKPVPYKFFVRKPTRSIIDESNLFYSAWVSRFIQDYGLMVAAMLDKRFLNDGGVLSKEESVLYDSLKQKQAELIVDYRSFLDKKDDARPKEDTDKMNKIMQEFFNISNELNKIENFQRDLYENTAEYKARQKTISWWILELSYEEKDGKESLLFSGKNFDEKMTKYDELAELEDEFYNEVLSKFTGIITLWSTGSASSKEEFDNIVSRLDASKATEDDRK